MTWLTSLPAVVLVAGGLVLALLATLGGRLAVRTLASEASFLASAQGIVSNEAADASRLAWAATSPGVATAPIQSALLDYLQATRSHEWSGGAAANGEDPATVHALANLENTVRDQ